MMTTDNFLSFCFAHHTINQAITLPYGYQKWLPLSETQALRDFCNMEEFASKDRSLQEVELVKEDTASLPSQHIFLT